ncbi:MAG: hypothetical protein SNJ71_05525 [Bacteroidales bacterium]
MEILSILEALEDLVEKSVSVPFSGKCLVDKEEILELIKEMRVKLPDDIKQSKWIKDERQRILLEAQKEANNMLKEAESRISLLVDEHQIARQAQEQSQEIIANAQRKAREMRLGANEYVDSILAKLEGFLNDTIQEIKSNRKELK